MAEMGNNLELFNQKYKASTPFDGVYVGRLIGNEGKTRKRFLIDGVIAPALPLELSGSRRSGYRVGQVIEVPGHAVKPTEANGTDYLSAVRNQISECKNKSDVLANAYLQVLVELQSEEFYCA
ncbi:MAG: hypothetical protein PHV02_21235 [Rhodocyclaceae bacterium]|nr:hypothetical protein [Rhodocyclaceae bacterium]